MAVNLATAYLTLIPSLKGAGAVIRTELEPAADAAGKSAGAKMGAGMAGGIKSSLGSLGLGALIGIGTTAVTSFVNGSVEKFASLEDATAAAGTVFGSSMNQISTQAADAAKTMGMTQAQAIEASITFGTFGKSAGLTGSNLAGFSTGMTQLAADMASFRGTSPDQAIQAIGAAMRGEMEPIRQYGVLLDDATLKAEAMKLGLVKSTKEALTPQQKVLAAQSAILKQTGDAQGDFARTGDSTANTMKTMSAAMENAQAQLGAKLAPAFTALLGAMIPVVEGLTNFFGFLSSHQEIIAGVGAVILTLLAPSLWASAVAAWAAAAGFFAALLPFLPLALAIGAVVAVIVLLYKNWDTVVAWLRSVWGQMGPWLAGIWEGIKTNIANFITSATNKFGELVTWLQGLPGRILAALGDFGKLLWNKGVDLIQGLLGGIQSMAGKIGSFFLNLLPSWLVVPFKAALGIASPSRVFAGFGQQIGDGLVMGIAGSGADVQSATRGMAGSAMAAMQMTARIPAPAARGSRAGVNGGGLNVTINNPAPEMASTSISRTYAKAAYLGLNGAY